MYWYELSTNDFEGCALHVQGRQPAGIDVELNIELTGASKFAFSSVFKKFFTLPYRVWSSIVIVHENSGFFPSYFSKYLKNG